MEFRKLLSSQREREAVSKYCTDLSFKDETSSKQVHCQTASSEIALIFLIFVLFQFFKEKYSINR